MTTDEVLKVVEERGMRVALNDVGQPVLKVLKGTGRSQATPCLLRVLNIHKGEILSRLRPKPRRQFLWRSSSIVTEFEGCQGFGDPNHYPTGAWWWRLEGEHGWHPIPGRNPDKLPPPEGEVLA